MKCICGHDEAIHRKNHWNTPCGILDCFCTDYRAHTSMPTLTRPLSDESYVGPICADPLCGHYRSLHKGLNVACRVKGCKCERYAEYGPGKLTQPLNGAEFESLTFRLLDAIALLNKHSFVVMTVKECDALEAKANAS